MKAQHAENALCGSVWPNGVTVRRFHPKNIRSQENKTYGGVSLAQGNDLGATWNSNNRFLSNRYDRLYIPGEKVSTSSALSCT